MLEKKKMKKWKLLLVVVIALGLVTGCSKKDDEKNNESTPVEEERPEEDQKEEEKETTYRLGDVVPVGDVEYVVNQKIVTDVLVMNTSIHKHRICFWLLKSPLEIMVIKHWQSQIATLNC